MENYSNIAESEQYEAMAYYRLSKSDSRNKKNKNKGDESDSISNQRKLINEYVKNHPNIKLVGEAQDDGYTGTNYDRPGFRDVLKAIRKGKVNCVIVKDLSRLGREYIETGRYLEMIFPSFGVRFIAVNDDVDSEKSKVEDDISIPIRNIMNESNCRELSIKLRRQFKVQRESGEFLGAFARYGYLKSSEDKHRLVVDEYAAEVVKSIFSYTLHGYNQNAVANCLNDMGILPPAEYKKSIGLKYKSGFKTTMTGKWSAAAVRSILTDPVYIGTLVQGRRGTPNYKVKVMRYRKPEEWSVVENNHDAIVDPLMFALVQKMLERDTRTSPNDNVVQPLSGVLFCPDCNRAMCRRSVTRGNKKFFYYVCSTNKQGHGCSSHSTPQEKLENAVMHAITNQINVVVELDKLTDDIGQRDVLAAKLRHIDLMIAQKNNDIDSYEDFRMKLYEALSDELINREEYNKMREKYTIQIDEAHSVARKMLAERKRLIENTDKDRGWIDQFSKFDGSSELTREMVYTLIDKIYVYEDKRIKIDFNYRNEMTYYQEILEQVSGEVS